MSHMSQAFGMLIRGEYGSVWADKETETTLCAQQRKLS